MKPLVFNYKKHEELVNQIEELKLMLADKNIQIQKLQHQLSERTRANDGIRDEIKQILNLSDPETQKLKWLEELGELIQAICKNDKASISGEMADVYICLEQMEEYYEMPRVIISSTIQYKLVRTIKRLKGVKENES